MQIKTIAKMVGVTAITAFAISRLGSEIPQIRTIFGTERSWFERLFGLS